MLLLFTGTDRDKTRAAMQREIGGRMGSAEIVRITDAHTIDDLRASLQGRGMFGGVRVVVFENVLANEEMAALLVGLIATLEDSEDLFVILEEKIDAPTRKKIEKYVDVSERFDAAKSGRDESVFDLGYAIQRGDKKNLWVGYMREIAKGSAPEMIHGILFWSAKQHLLKTGQESGRTRAAALVATLTELPHRARREGCDMEYALEKFVLSVT